MRPQQDEESLMFLKRLTAVAAFALVVAACGGGADTAATTTTQAGEMTDGGMTETTMTSDDSMTDDTMTDDTMTDDTMTDDTMTDDTMTDDTMTDDTMTDDTMTDHMGTAFTVTITNDTGNSTVQTAISPGVFAVHTSMDTLFAEGSVDRGDGLEALAEDGDPAPLLATLQGEDTVFHTHVFDTPDGSAAAGVAGPGSSYTFTFNASPGDYLSFATMFVESNDWFYAPAPTGISLFDGDTPLQGDISEQILLWDAGTELDEPLGSGSSQGAREPAANTGETESVPIATVPGYAGTLTVTISVVG
jgi:hypothetical protein